MEARIRTIDFGCFFTIQDNYSNKYNELWHISGKNLLTKLKAEIMLISMVNTHKSNDVSSVCLLY